MLPLENERRLSISIFLKIGAEAEVVVSKGLQKQIKVF
jgi:hypothetical protein